MRRPSLEDGLLAGLFVACLAYSLVSAGIGWNNLLLEQHGFRQTQTALTTYYLLQGGPWFAYETPLFGTPWAIPFEFPLYQWTVALFVELLGTPLDQTGRFVSELYFYATLIPAYALLATFRVRPSHRLIFLVLLLVSPEYLFWSRSFMIESTALFCGVSYLACAVRSVHDRRARYLLGTVLFGALAATVKITTFFVFLLGAGVYLLGAHRKRGEAWFHQQTISRVIVLACAVAALPLASGLLWTFYTDAIKAQNPLAAHFLTSDALAEWNFGTLSKRLSGEFWSTLLNRTLPDLVGHAILAVAGLGLLLIGRREAMGLACVALFLSAPLTFTNLHIIHNYYTYANGVFLIAALGWSIVGALERGGWRRQCAVVAFACTIGASVWWYQISFVPLQKTNIEWRRQAREVLQESTGPNDVVLIFGLDWSSEVPYYARRRALMNRDNRPPDDPSMQRALANLSGQRLGAMVVCLGVLRDRELIAQWLQVTGLSPVPLQTVGCEVYLPPA